MINTASHWLTIIQRGPSADGTFVYSVASTSVYRRPSCPSRQARQANVAFHATLAATEAAGFRPCLRCNPNRPLPAATRAARLAAACRRIDAAEPPIPLETLAREAGLSRFHFHRQFRETTGITPAAYAAPAYRRHFPSTPPSPTPLRSRP